MSVGVPQALLRLRPIGTARPRLGEAETEGHNSSMAQVDSRELTVLYGRERESEVLGSLLNRVSERGSALVVRGEPGIGKTALLEATSQLARSRGFRVLTATGVQSEAELPYAGLHQLLRPIDMNSKRLPGPQRAALSAAFGRTSSLAPDLFLIALATLNLLTDSAAGEPMLVLADDAQWLDRPTSDVFAFIARRLASDPIVMLFALRSGLASPLLELEQLELRGLDQAAADELLNARASVLGPALRRRVLDEANGNPLALMELPAALVSERGQERAGIESVMPLTPRLEKAFTSRFAELTEPTRTALLVASIDDLPDLDEVLKATSRVRGELVTIDYLNPAVTGQLIDVGQTEVRFRHPLIRSAIRQAASLSDRLTAHAALADVIEDQPDRRAWHRAASVVGRNEPIAAELDDVASRARARGAVTVSVSALERAASLTPDPGLRAERLLRAAELAFELGNRQVVGRLVREAEPLASYFQGPIAEARMTLVRGLVDPALMQPAQVRSMVATAKHAKNADDVDLAWSILWLVAQRCFWADPGREVREIVVGAAEEFAAGGNDARAVAVIAYAAPIERSQFVIDHLRGWPATAGDTEASRLLAGAAIVVGAFDLAARIARHAVDSLRAHGRLGQLPRALVLQTWSAICAADWKVAMPAADEAARLAAEIDDPVWGAGAHAMNAMLAALRGDSRGTAELAREAESMVVSIGASFMLAAVQEARGLIALAEGRHDEAYDELRRIYDRTDPAYHRVLCYWYAGDFAEAAAHSGHRDAARMAINDLSEALGDSPSSWIASSMRYARTQLADDTDADEQYRSALESDLASWPFQRARLQLAYGEWLRRQHRVAESRTPLRAASDAFDALGLFVWAERARQELRAAGEISRRKTTATWDRLTPQEIQIATMAADGLSNRQIGQKLYLSHRTVGSHLYRIFPKLGVTSRAQLRNVLAST